jgi:hypothetical protein
LRREKGFQIEYIDYKTGNTSGNKLKKVAASSRDSIPVRRSKAMAPKGNILCELSCVIVVVLSLWFSSSSALFSFTVQVSLLKIKF